MPNDRIPLTAPFITKAQQAHDLARDAELREACEDNANARSIPGYYGAPLGDYETQCGCVSRVIQECDGESVWETRRWDAGGCKGLIVTAWESTPALWSARREDYDGGDPPDPQGFGKTVDEAIADLLDLEAARRGE